MNKKYNRIGLNGVTNSEFRTKKCTTNWLGTWYSRRKFKIVVRELIELPDKYYRTKKMKNIKVFDSLVAYIFFNTWSHSQSISISDVRILWPPPTKWLTIIMLSYHSDYVRNDGSTITHVKVLEYSRGYFRATIDWCDRFNNRFEFNLFLNSWLL